MAKKSQGFRARLMGWGAAAAAGLLSLGLLNTGAIAAAGAAQGPNAPLVQQFEDVPDSNPFSSFINALYVDGIIAGYTCGGVGEPCVAPLNRPYYRPGANVNRGQMAKFVENGRRNIDTAVGQSLYLNGTAFRALEARTTSNGEGVHGTCLTAGVPCYGVEGDATNAGNYGGVFYGGAVGVYASTDISNTYGLQARANGTGSYAADISSDVYRSLLISEDSNYYAMYVDTDNLAADFEGEVDIYGALYVSAGCTGCLAGVTVQNVGDSALEAGDVVSAVGSSTSTDNQSPVLLVHKAAAQDKAVVGVVSGAVYMPSASTVAAYKAEQQAIATAKAARDAAQKRAMANNQKLDVSQYAVPQSTITDAQGRAHAVKGAMSVNANSFGTVVTNGTYQTVKVDASFGAIHVGDQLVASAHAGYAMKADDKATGIVLGKAMGNLESGTGTVTVLITLK
ncbi:MAG TPA: S-layer homology domain-containing protein [Chloroflexia bacterium]|nr:S-layer homology domain-containing protein [Chloroflexia bacterium]